MWPENGQGRQVLVRQETEYRNEDGKITDCRTMNNNAA